MQATVEEIKKVEAEAKEKRKVAGAKRARKKKQQQVEDEELALFAPGEFDEEQEGSAGRVEVPPARQEAPERRKGAAAADRAKVAEREEEEVGEEGEEEEERPLSPSLVVESDPRDATMPSTHRRLALHVRHFDLDL